MKPGRLCYLVVAFMALTTSCSGGGSSTQSLSAEGVVACSSQLFWATKAKIGRQTGSSTEIYVTVRKWLKPTSGPTSTSLIVVSTGMKTESGLPTDDWTLDSFLVVGVKGGDP